MELLRNRIDILIDKALANDAKARYKLARCLYKGHLVEKDTEAAKYWAFKAIINSYIKAGRLFEKIS